MFTPTEIGKFQAFMESFVSSSEHYSSFLFQTVSSSSEYAKLEQRVLALEESMTTWKDKCVSMEDSVEKWKKRCMLLEESNAKLHNLFSSNLYRDDEIDELVRDEPKLRNDEATSSKEVATPNEESENILDDLHGASVAMGLIKKGTVTPGAQDNTAESNEEFEAILDDLDGTSVEYQGEEEIADGNSFVLPLTCPPVAASESLESLIVISQSPPTQKSIHLDENTPQLPSVRKNSIPDSYQSPVLTSVPTKRAYTTAFSKTSATAKQPTEKKTVKSPKDSDIEDEFYGEGHKFKAVIRNKDQRKHMHAKNCACCSGYYKAVSNAKVDENIPANSKLAADTAWKEAEQKRMQISSRHRTLFQENDTPEGFWDINFWATQDDKDKKKKEIVKESPTPKKKPKKRPVF